MRSRETDVSQWKLLDSGLAEGCESFRELIRNRLSQVIRWKKMTRGAVAILEIQMLGLFR